MATTYYDDMASYILRSDVGDFVVTAKAHGTGDLNYTDDQLNSAMQAFVNALNVSLVPPINLVTKHLTATGTSDWSYTP